LTPFESQERIFGEPWEAQAFAMAVKLNEAGVFTWTEWAETLGAEIAAKPLAPYYENWLAALEKLAERKGTMSEAERLARIDAWDRAARATPHGEPIELSRAPAVPGMSPEATAQNPGARR
jgi:nitrile hydratase accessory protein